MVKVGGPEAATERYLTKGLNFELQVNIYMIRRKVSPEYNIETPIGILILHVLLEIGGCVTPLNFPYSETPCLG